MQRETAKRLLDARTACDEIASFTAGKTQDAILTDRGLQLILQTLVGIIGEALGQLRRTDPDVAAAIPDLHRIVAMRNQIVHAYDSIDYLIVWRVATVDIPRLKPILTGMMNAREPNEIPNDP
jgi:uncharacterized protein with HEPN domain